MIGTRHLPVITGAALVAATVFTACGASGSPTAHTSEPNRAGTAPGVAAKAKTDAAAGAKAGPAGVGSDIQLASDGSAVQAPGATVTSEGVGTVTGAPDTLTVGIGVSTTNLHAAAALQQNNTIAAAVQSALEADGVAQTDIQTTGLSLQQNYDSGGNPDGYTVYDEVTATVKQLAKAGTIIDDALAPAGDSGRLDQVSFSMSDTDPLMAAARQQAVQSAKVQAQQMAVAAGGQLGALVSLSDVTDQDGSPSFENGVASSAGFSASAMAPVPLQPGKQQVSVNVYAVWQVVSSS
jgi:uncharacterized protein YggE